MAYDAENRMKTVTGGGRPPAQDSMNLLGVRYLLRLLDSIDDSAMGAARENNQPLSLHLAEHRQFAAKIVHLGLVSPLDEHGRVCLLVRCGPSDWSSEVQSRNYGLRAVDLDNIQSHPFQILLVELPHVDWTARRG
jgi:hypothetical protein